MNLETVGIIILALPTTFLFVAGSMEGRPKFVKDEKVKESLTSCGLYFAYYVAAVIAGLLLRNNYWLVCGTWLLGGFALGYLTERILWKIVPPENLDEWLTKAKDKERKSDERLEQYKQDTSEKRQEETKKVVVDIINNTKKEAIRKRLRNSNIIIFCAVFLLVVLIFILHINPVDVFGLIGFLMLGFKIFQWILVKEYRCSNCFTLVSHNSSHCYKCGAILTNFDIEQSERKAKKEKAILIWMTILIGVLALLMFGGIPSLMNTSALFGKWANGSENEKILAHLMPSAGIGYIIAWLIKGRVLD